MGVKALTAAAVFAFSAVGVSAALNTQAGPDLESQAARGDVATGAWPWRSLTQTTTHHA